MSRFLTVPLLAFACVVGARPAIAQEHRPLTVAVGSTTLSEDPPGTFFPSVDYDRGWAVSVSYTFLWNKLGAVADFGANKRFNFFDEEQELKYYLFGARYNIMKTRWLVPYAVALAGREEFTEPGLIDEGTAFQVGGGVDALLWKGIGARGEVDYQIVKYDGDQGRYKNWRIFVGGVVAIGW